MCVFGLVISCQDLLSGSVGNFCIRSIVVAWVDHQNLMNLTNFGQIVMTDFLKIWKNWIVGGGLVAAVGLILWGIPYYIKVSVSGAVAAEINAREQLQGKSVDIQNLELQYTTIITQLDGMVRTDNRIEAKITNVEENQQEFGQIFMDYLSRQAQ